MSLQTAQKSTTKMKSSRNLLILIDKDPAEHDVENRSANLIGQNLDGAADTLPSDIPQADWGRKSKAQWKNSIGALCLVVACPSLMVTNWVILEYYQGSVMAMTRSLGDDGIASLLMYYFPRPTLSATFGYMAWLLLQAFLYLYLPGPNCYGQRTPGGNLLQYITNGFTAWIVTHLMFLAGTVLGLIDPAVVARHWEGLLVIANVYGFTMAVFAQVKGYWNPSYAKDRKLSGNGCCISMKRPYADS